MLADFPHAAADVYSRFFQEFVPTGTDTEYWLRNARNTDCGSFKLRAGPEHRMFIHNMTEAECRRLLKEARVGRLACAQDNQPYIVPMYFAYSERHLYAISTIGQKIEWMRANPLVCVQVDELTSHDNWKSVIIFGRYEELPDIPEYKNVRELALALLAKRSVWWWEPACIPEDHRDNSHSSSPVAYRIHIAHISGHRATPDPVASLETQAESKTAKRNLISNFLARVRHIPAKRRHLP